MGGSSSKEPEERKIELENYIVFTKPTKYDASVKVCGENKAKLVSVKTQNKLDTLCGLLKTITSNIKWRVGSPGGSSKCQPASKCKYSIHCAKKSTERKNRAVAILKSRDPKLPFLCEKNPRKVTPNILANKSTAPTNSPGNITATTKPRKSTSSTNSPRNVTSTTKPRKSTASSNSPRNITATTQPRKSTASSFPTNTTRKSANYSTPVFSTRPSPKSNYRSWKTAPSPYQRNHLTIGFGVVAFVFLSIVIGLLIYVCKQRQKQNRRAREVVQASNQPPLIQIIVDREIHPSVEEAHNHQVPPQQQHQPSTRSHDFNDYVGWNHIKCSTNEEVDAPAEELYAQVDKRKKDIPSSSRLPQHTDNDDVIVTTQAEQPMYAEIHKSKNPR